jgi:Zn-dependent metalloprotease/chitodextrinase
MKPMNLYPWVFLLLLFFAGTTLAQKSTNDQVSSFIKLDDPEKYPETDAEKILQQNLKTTTQDFSFQLQKTDSDQLGFKHQTYQQLYKGIPVEFATQKVHAKAGFIQSVTGEIQSFATLETTPSLSAEEGLQRAMNHIAAASYLWENASQTGLLESYEKPNGQLVIFPEMEHITSTPKLAYRYFIQAEEPLYMGDIYIDAHTGEVIFEHSKIVHADVSANGQSLYNGQVNFTAEEPVPGNYRLKQSTTGGGVWTSDWQGNTYGSVEIQSTNTTFNHPVGVQAHWSAEQTYNYYSQVHNRNSYDGNDAQMRLFVDDANANNAVWLGNKASFGNGDGTSFNPFVSLDIVGHEFTHGVVQTTANLIYQNESGALNESFADIFGECVEHFATGAKDWHVGADVTITATALRSFSNPNSLGFPDTYLGQYWSTSPFDNGGVHTNSSVQNHWFYLLSEGGNGANDFGSPYTVSAIGMTKAAAIAYRALSVYLTNSSNYFDARAASVQAAEDLYGVNSSEADAVKDAWHAVGVGLAANDNSSYNCANSPITMEINFDQKPDQTAFYIKDFNNNMVFFQPLGSFNNTVANSSLSIPITGLTPGNYMLGFGDWGPNGICCEEGNGGYTLTDGTNTLASGGDFDFIENTQFCVTQPIGRDFDLVKPTAPIIIAAHPTETSIDVTWTASTDDQSGVDYFVFYGEKMLIGNIVDTTATITGLSPNTSYTINVFARDAEGNLSDKESEMIVNTLPANQNCGNGTLTLEFQLDGQPQETAWEIKDINNVVMASSGAYGYDNEAPNSFKTETISGLANGDYILVVYDEGGNGLTTGNYVLKDAAQNILASGSQFNFSHVTEFCLGTSNGGGLDVQSPTTPFNLVAFNPTANSIDISYVPSTDNVGVLYYGLFVDGVYMGYFNANYPVPLTIPGLTPNTTYNFQLVARDWAGNFSGFSNTATATTLPGTVTIHEGYFETGLDGWTDGGIDCKRVKVASRSYEGERSMMIRDNSGEASSMTLENLDLTPYSEITLDFQYYLYSFENNEDFWVRYFDGTTWVTVEDFVNQVDFNGDGFYSASLTLNSSQYNFTSNAKIRIQCDASGNGDKVYVDQVIINGVPVSNNMQALAQEGEDIAPFLNIQETAILRSPQASSNDIQLLETDNDNVQFKIFPNPAHQAFQIKGLDIQSTTNINLINTAGVLQKSYYPTDTEFGINDLPKGVYWVQILRKDGLPIIKKLIIQ